VESCGRGGSVEYESREQTLVRFYWGSRKGMSRSCICYFRDESLGKVSTLIASERGEGRVLTRREMRVPEYHWEMVLA